MAKLTSPERLSADIQMILAEYEAGVIAGANTAIKQLANKGRNAVRRNARAKFTRSSRKSRKYSNGWMYKMERWSNKAIAGAVIYEKNQPGLAHLLEHGHAKVNGGRTKAREHVKPVEDQLASEIVREVVKNI